MSDETKPTGWTREVLFSTTGSEGRGDWRTPAELFELLDHEFKFGLDAAATSGNALCERWIGPCGAWDTKGSGNWHGALDPTVSGVERGRAAPRGRRSGWLNPPYGRGLDAWIKKAYEESLKGCTVVVLIFARTCTRWWQDWAMKAAQVRLLRGRVYFEVDGKRGPSPAPSCVLVFSESLRTPTFTGVEYPRGFERRRR